MNYSPLRYPGGKSKLIPLVNMIMNKTGVADITYIEPFAGGAGVALGLLNEGTANKIVINDYDKAIYSFWRALKEEPQELIGLIQNTPITIAEWRHQNDVFSTKNDRYSVELGFAAFYLNRTNRSGILNAGPIGGYNQEGSYCIDARYNKADLIGRIEAIAKHRNRIIVYNKEIRSFINKEIPKYPHAFVYFDPPYFKNGQRLYKNSFSATDHSAIAAYIASMNCPWIVTYDDVPEIREIYSEFPKMCYSLNYSVANKGKGSELIIFKDIGLIPSKEEVKAKMHGFTLSQI